MMRPWARRTLEISALLTLMWLSMIALLVFIDRVILAVPISDPLLRALFRNGTSFALFGLLLLGWWRLSAWYYAWRVRRPSSRSARKTK